MTIILSGASVSGLVYGPYLDYRKYGENVISETGHLHWSISRFQLHTDGSKVLFEVLWID